MSARQSLEDVTFVLIGVLGSGKSSTGNVILDQKCFKTGAGTKPITEYTEKGSTRRNGVRVTVLDTPGLKKAADLTSIKDEIKRNYGTPMGKVVYLIVIQIGRYTNEERLILETIFKKFKSILKNPVVIFTNRDELKDEDNIADSTIDSWVSKNPSLKTLLHNYGLRYLAFENKHSLAEEKDVQVKDLFAVVSGAEEADFPCPVSDNKRQNSEGVFVNRDLMVKHFGQSGREFYDDQLELQSHITNKK